MNSVAPETKRAAAAGDRGGGRALCRRRGDGAGPSRRASPCRCWSPGRSRRRRGRRSARARLHQRRVVGGAGRRRLGDQDDPSVMVKGIEALTAECVLAAEARGVLDEVLASLDASWPRRRLGRARRLQSRPHDGPRPAPRRRDGRSRRDARRARHRAGDDPRHRRAPARDRRARPRARPTASPPSSTRSTSHGRSKPHDHRLPRPLHHRARRARRLARGAEGGVQGRRAPPRPIPRSPTTRSARRSRRTSSA